MKMELKNLRKSKNMKVEELANAINVTPASYYKYESGVNEPPADVLIRIADFFGVTVDYLIGHNANNSLGYINAETSELVKDIKKLSDKNFSAVKGYVAGLLQSQSD